jgi:hypothetical protein
MTSNIDLCVIPCTWDKQRIAKVLQTDCQIPANLTRLLSGIAIGIVFLNAAFAIFFASEIGIHRTFLAKEAGGLLKMPGESSQKLGGQAHAICSFANLNEQSIPIYVQARDNSLPSISGEPPNAFV